MCIYTYKEKNSQRQVYIWLAHGLCTQVLTATICRFLLLLV